MSLASIGVHARLAGPLQVTAGTTRLEPADFPGRQGRLVFAALALSRGPVDRNALAEVLWPNRLPSSWTRDLSAVVSKLRTVLSDVAGIATAGGRWYELQLPDGATIDVEVAHAAVDRAARAGADGDTARALADAELAAAILREPFLAGDECAWVDDRRAELREQLFRALVLRTELLCGAGSPDAVAAAHELVELEPNREQPYVLLMRAHLALGDRVAALREYERLRRLLAEEFGLFPSAAADAVLRDALGPDEPPTGAARALGLPVAIAEARRTAIVGRAAELRALDAVLGPSASTRFAVVLGAAGIGKSRLVAEAAVHAHEQGCLVLYGAGDEGAATPYRVLVDAFTSARLTAGGDDPLGRQAGTVVDRFAEGDPPSGLDGGARRSDFFAAVATAVADFVRDRTLVLVVDDLQWADPSSLRMLEHLLAVVPAVHVLATVRSADASDTELSPLLARARARDTVHFVRLGGLALSDVGAALAGLGAGDLDHALLHAIHHATSGNPLYVREVGRHLAVAGHPPFAPGKPLLDAIGLPQGLAELIDANVARLGAPARRVLEVAAVIGGSIEFGVLERACELSRPDLLDALDVARRAEVLVESSTDTAALRFDHPLVREVLLHGLGASRRAHLHQRVAEAIEAYHHDEVDRYSAELAHHLAAAAHMGSAKDAIEFAVRAGERANAVCAYDEAVHWFAHALRLARERADDAHAVASLLVALGNAQNHAGDAATARATLVDAVAVARDARDPEWFARAVLQLGAVLVDEGFEGGTVDDDLVALLGEAIDGLPESSALRARLSVRLAEELHFVGDRERCLALCDEAAAIARAAHDDEAVAAVLGARHYALYGTPDVTERLALLSELQTLRPPGRPEARWARDYLELGDLQAVAAATAHLDRQIETAGIASDRYYPVVLRGTLAALQGDLERAEAIANDAVEVGRAAARGPAAVAGVWAAQVFAVRLFDGRLAELADLVDASADASPNRPIWRAAAAFMHLELGDHDAAAAHYRQLAGPQLERLPATLDRPMTLALLAWVAAEIGSAADARRLRSALTPYRDLLVVLGAAAPSVCAGPVTYPLGLLEQRLGRPEHAAQLLDDAERRSDEIGAVLWRDRIRRARAQLAPAPV